MADRSADQHGSSSHRRGKKRDDKLGRKTLDIMSPIRWRVYRRDFGGIFGSKTTAMAC